MQSHKEEKEGGISITIGGIESVVKSNAILG